MLKWITEEYNQYKVFQKQRSSLRLSDEHCGLDNHQICKKLGTKIPLTWKRLDHPLPWQRQFDKKIPRECDSASEKQSIVPMVYTLILNVNNPIKAEEH